MNIMADDKKNSPKTVMLKNVRLSFPHLFRPQASKDEGGTPKFNCSFLMDPATPHGKANIAKLKAAIEFAQNEKWAGKVKVPGDKRCLRKGNDPETGEAKYDGYDQMIFCSASNSVRPLVIDRNRAPLIEADGKPYGGCYVNAKVNIWAQDNKFGKRINASLEAVQFYTDGERFGAAPTDSDEFDEYGDDDDAVSGPGKGSDDDDDVM